MKMINIKKVFNQQIAHIKSRKLSYMLCLLSVHCFACRWVHLEGGCRQ